MSYHRTGWLWAGCLACTLTLCHGIAQGRDKEKDKDNKPAPSKSLPTIKAPPASKAPAAGRDDRPSSGNRGFGSGGIDTAKPRVEPQPKVDRRNDNPPPSNARTLPPFNSGANQPGRSNPPQNVLPSLDSQRSNRGDNKTTGNNPLLNSGNIPRANQPTNPTIGKGNVIPTPPADRKDRGSLGGEKPQPGTLPDANRPFGGTIGRDNDKNKPDRRNDGLPLPPTGTNPGAPSLSQPKTSVLPPPTLSDKNRPRDRQDGDNKIDNNSNVLNGRKQDVGRPGTRPSDDSKGVVGNRLPGTLGDASNGKTSTWTKAVPIRVEKNGQAPKLNALNTKPEVNEKVAKLWQTKDRKEFEKQINELKVLPEAKANPQLASLKLDRVSGVFQQRVEKQEFRHWHDTDVGRRLNLDRQFEVHRRGDLSRQLNLGPALIQAGGWQHRRHGVVIPTYTQSSFSCWYAGGGYYPRYSWCPRWTTWVDWCWWDTCLPIYDPRPVYCRPVVYTPCPTWVVYEYPVWQTLPVVTCGTWVDVPPVVVDSGTDLQLLAVRFVDNGHPDQNLGPRYRVWLRNNGPLSTSVPFNVLLMAANDVIPLPELPQAGAVVNGIDAGEIQPVDIRLPLSANKLAVTPEGQRVPFSHLHVLVDSHRDLVEPDETNNGSVIVRNDILPVDPAAFSSDVSAAAPGTIINVAGEGFGPEPGQVIVSVNGLQLQAEIHGWYDLGVRFALPNIALAGPVDADVLVVRGDGAAANPLDMQLAPATALLSEGPLPPPPSP